MAQIPEFFVGGQSAIASYDFSDIATGTGYEIYYAGNAPSGTTFLASDTFYSDFVAMWKTGAVESSEGNANASAAHLVLNYDLKFNLPRYVNGRCIIEIPHGWQDSGDQSTTQRVTATIQKIDLSDVTTNLLHLSGSAWTASGQGVSTETKTNLTTLSATISGVQFKKNETLRLVVKPYTWEVGSNTHDVFIGNDPQGRISSANLKVGVGFAPSGVTALRVFLPFRIDL